MKIQPRREERHVEFYRLRTFYPKGSIIFREEDSRDNAYIIESGMVEISTTKQGRSIPLVRLGSGEVFGETALLGEGPRSATAIAIEDTEVFTISPALLRTRIMDMDPLVGLLMSLLVNRYRQWRFVSPDEVPEINPTPPVESADAENNMSQGFLADLNLQKDIALRELRMAQEITAAIGNREFNPYLQPIMTLPGRKLAGFEVLVRWHHPERGVISPMEFIPIAERTQVVWDLDMMMLRYACEMLPGLRHAAGPEGKNLYVSVNLSGAYFDDLKVVDDIRKVLEETGVDPSGIMVEITESALMNEPMVAEMVLKDIKNLGVRIALDDFGTGYSSLSYLHRFPIDVLKIDRSFVQDIQDNAKSQDIVQAIVTLAKTFDLKIIGEGIESGEEIIALSCIGCDYGQGYYFSRPVPLSEAMDFVRDKAKS